MRLFLLLAVLSTPLHALVFDRDYYVSPPRDAAVDFASGISFLVSDSSGSAYIAGHDTFFQAFLIKVGPDGTKRWDELAAADLGVVTTGLAVDSQSNVYWAFYHRGDPEPGKLRKYSFNGLLLATTSVSGVITGVGYDPVRRLLM